MTGLWLTNRTQKAGWQWRTLADRHPSLRWGDAELSLHIQTQLQLCCESSLLRLFSIPSQLCHSPTLSFVIISSCTVRLWRPERRMQTVLMGVDRPAAEASEVTVKPLLYTVLPETSNHTNAHSFHSSPPYIPGSDWFFFFQFTYLICIYGPFWCHSWPFTGIPFLHSLHCLGPMDAPLTSPGWQIKWEQATSWAENWTCHLYWAVKYKHSPTV